MKKKTIVRHVKQYAPARSSSKAVQIARRAAKRNASALKVLADK